MSEEYRGNPAHLDNFTRQDSIVLNLLRACEASIDLGMHHVAQHRLGVPQSSREAFTLLEKSGFLSPESANSMRNMVGFRNIAVHAYQELERPILEAILNERLSDFTSFLEETRNIPAPPGI